jgi:hypothetical protein
LPPSKGKFAQLTSWSFSVYTRYCKCPLEVCFDKIQRIWIEEPDNPHFVKGNRAHAIADTFISGAGKKRPALVEKVPFPGQKPIEVNLTSIKDQLADLRTKKARTEQEWAFDRQWVPCDWKDWDRAWLRIKTDVCADSEKPPTVEIVDWKTGRPHLEDHKLQRSIYALGGLQLVQLGVLAGGSKNTKLTTSHVYLDAPDVTATEEFTFKQLPALKREWLARTKEMFEDTTYTARPGFHCKWCKFSKKNGGPCKEG